MTQTTNQVFTTDEYDNFKTLSGNRNVNQLHLKRLEKSILKNPLFTVIMVNERFEIIDGQHRFEIIKKHKLPLNYIVCKGYGINEVHILNANQKKFDAIDYLDGYVKQGIPEYIKFKNFMDRYKFGINTCISLWRGGVQNDSKSRHFYSGNFKCADYQQAEKLAIGLVKIKAIFPDADRQTFVCAYLAVSKSSNWDVDEFVDKLKFQKGKLLPGLKARDFITIIEEIYNFKRREKVSLKYS